jgi:cyanophycinase-like exopeptidase
MIWAKEAKQMIKSMFTALGLTLASTAMLTAGPVENACNRSSRDAANPSLCNCIQQVADMTLTGGDQRRAASFFKDPQKAHNVWMSKSKSDDLFWDRYKEFGAMAEAYCAGT